MFALFHNPEVAQAQQDVVQAQHSEPECVLPRRENTSYQTNDPPILTAKLVESKEQGESGEDYRHQTVLAVFKRQSKTSGRASRLLHCDR